MAGLEAGVPPKPAGPRSPTQSSKAAAHTLAWPGYSVTQGLIAGGTY